jgi:hypothetical protein
MIAGISKITLKITDNSSYTINLYAGVERSRRFQGRPENSKERRWFFAHFILSKI